MGSLFCGGSGSGLFALQLSDRTWSPDLQFAFTSSLSLSAGGHLWVCAQHPPCPALQPEWEGWRSDLSPVPQWNAAEPGFEAKLTEYKPQTQSLCCVIFNMLINSQLSVHVICASATQIKGGDSFCTDSCSGHRTRIYNKAKMQEQCLSAP